MDRNMAKNIEQNLHIKSPKIIMLDVSTDKYFVSPHTYMYMNMGSRSWASLEYRVQFFLLSSALHQGGLCSVPACTLELLAEYYWALMPLAYIS